MTTVELKNKCEEDLKGIQAALTEKSASFEANRSEVDYLQKQLAVHENSAERLQVQVNGEVEEKNNLAADITSLKENISKLEIELEEFQKEMSGLSFMAFGRKKELKTIIESAQKLLDEKKGDLRKKTERFVVVSASKTEEMLAVENAAIEESKKVIAEKQFQIGKLEQEISGLEIQHKETKKQLAEAEAVLEAKAKEEAEIKAKEEAEARAKAEAERLKAETEAKAKEAAEAEAKAKLEAEIRAKIEAEIRAKIEAEMRAKLEAETAEREAQNAKKESTFVRPRIADPKLAKVVDRAIDKLEAYFPERKIFALNSIDSTLRENLSGLYKRANYATIDDMFAAYGFEVISGDAVKELRSFVMYNPG